MLFDKAIKDNVRSQTLSILFLETFNSQNRASILARLACCWPRVAPRSVGGCLAQFTTMLHFLMLKRISNLQERFWGHRDGQGSERWSILSNQPVLFPARTACLVPPARVRESSLAVSSSHQPFCLFFNKSWAAHAGIRRHVARSRSGHRDSITSPPSRDVFPKTPPHLLNSTLRSLILIQTKEQFLPYATAVADGDLHGLSNRIQHAGDQAQNSMGQRRGACILWDFVKPIAWTKSYLETRLSSIVDTH